MSYIEIKNQGKTHELPIELGKSILSHIQSANIDIVAQCGGHGTCGKCKVQLLEGNLTKTTEDTGFFTEDELNKGWRLACLAYPKDNCTINIESEIKDYSVIADHENITSDINSGIYIKELKIDDKSISLTNLIKEQLGQKMSISVTALRKLSGFINKSNKFYNEDIAYCVINNDEIINVSDDCNMSVYGLVVDIGTTTIAIELVNIQTGQVIEKYTSQNSQHIYGADVISRIQSANNGNLDRLHKLIQEDILHGINELCKLIDNGNIYKMTIVGNTTMIHLLLGLPCESIGVYPFIATSTRLLKYKFRDVFDSDLIDCNVNILPSINTFVGSDVVAGILQCNIINSDRPMLLIDIGTNGEMAIGNRDRILCTSTAAGPTFEGGNISAGIGSIAGAIYSVKFRDNNIEYKVIGETSPIGICGTGVVDIVAEGLDKEIIDETGLLINNDNDYILIDKDNNIFFTQQDIREVQLAKSAIRAGIESLISNYGCSYEEIAEVYIAGGFGYRLNVENAIKIGLFPEEFREKIRLVGNTSLGGGFQYLLNINCEDTLTRIIEITNSINLANDNTFNNAFIEHMFFGS